MSLPKKSRTYIDWPEPEYSDYAEMIDPLRTAKGMALAVALVIGACVIVLTVWEIVR
jgi:hypothetical protein